MGDNELTCRILTEDDYPLWERLIRESPTGSIYNSVSYLQILCAATGGSYRVAGIFERGELVGGIALYESYHGALRGVGNRLLLYYNGFVLKGVNPEKDSSENLRRLASLAEWLSVQGYSWFDLHCRTPRVGGITDFRAFLSRGWNVSPTYSYVVTLAGAWQQMDKNIRRLVRRAEEAGITVKEEDDFESFFALHKEIHDRKAAPIYLPYEQFKVFVSALREKGLGQILTARLADGTAVASQLVLTGNFAGSHTVCAGAAQEHLALGATPLLRWKAFERLSALGYTWNDLTDASLNSVTRFKSQLGGELQMSFNVYNTPPMQLGVVTAAKSLVRGLKCLMGRYSRRAP